MPNFKRMRRPAAHKKKSRQGEDIAMLQEKKRAARKGGLAADSLAYKDDIDGA